MKAKMFDTIDAYRDEMIALSDDIYDHPELALKEYHAADVLIRCLEDKGCRVERGVGGLETAFRTQIRTLRAGRRSACLPSMTRCLAYTMPAGTICRALL